MVQKNKIGFPIQIVGCLIYIYLMFGVDWSIVLVNSVFLAINIFGWINWKKMEEEDEVYKRIEQGNTSNKC